jgi:twitching motility protein PilT
MPRIDVYLQSLVKYNATSVVLATGQNVTLRFSTGGDRFANQTSSQADLQKLVEEIAPPASNLELKRGARSSFGYDYQGQTFTISVDPKPGLWRVNIEPGAHRSTVDLPPALFAAAAEAIAAPPPPPPSSTSRSVVEPMPRPPVEPPRAPPPAPPPPARQPRVSASGNAASPIELMLIEMRELGCSDLHLSSNNIPMARLHGEIKPLAEGYQVLGPEAMMELLRPIVPEKNRREFEERNDTDFAHAIPGVCRFRANVFRDRFGPGAVFRAIPFNIQTPEQLGLPKGVLELCFLTKGLVVVTGPTGSGKSTTLATLIDYVNRSRQDHIITIEDPIEFVHENKSCLVNQREIHTHTRSFKDALRAALREDPDIVLVGEMRDLETIAIAVETAETGHLVFGTLHTTTAPSTVDRIIDQFPADRQDQIRQMLAESLRGVIAQTLCKRIGGGRIAAYEILLGSSAVSNLIRERKTFQLFSLMQTGRAHGMITMNDSLIDLVKRKLVDPREAYMKAVNKNEFKGVLAREGIAAGFLTEMAP